MNEEVFYFIMRVIVGMGLGAILGSFITMLTFRVPRGKSLINPPSSCPACRKPIKWNDLIPIYSYWQLKGKCRACGAEYGKSYLTIEVVSAIATTLALLYYGVTTKAFMIIGIFVIVYSIGIIVARQGKEIF